MCYGCKPFLDCNVCPQCDNIGIDVKFYEGEGEDVVYKDGKLVPAPEMPQLGSVAIKGHPCDRLRKTCNRCGHTWLEHPKGVKCDDIKKKESNNAKS